MDKLHRPRIHKSKKLYDRKNKWRDNNATAVEYLPVKQELREW